MLLKGLLNKFPIPKSVAESVIWKNYIRRFSIKLYNKIFANELSSVFYEKRLIKTSGNNQPSGLAIGDYICTIFSDVIVQKPSFIVELGTRGGESTKAVLAAASYSQATVLSIDVDDCGYVDLPEDFQKNWHFVQSDDVIFGQDHFIDWCKSNGTKPEIDVLFIDSSHLYEHTKQEIDIWFKYIAEDGIVIFHDTNMARLYRKLNNSLAFGWNNNRGVIRAIEDYFDRDFDENKVFVTTANNWLVRHYPYSSGLTLLKRIKNN